MFFYNLFISLVTRDSVFRFYLISLVILILNTLDTSGVIFDLFPGFGMLPKVLNIWHCIEPHFLTIALLLYAKDFLKIKDRYPWWGKVIDYSVYALLVMAGIILIDFKIGLPLIVLNTLPFIVIMFTVGIKSYRDAFAGSLYFIIGHAFWFLGGTATMLAQLGILPKIDFFLIHAFPLGSSLEMVLFSLALANTINFLRAENERKQKVLIDQLQKNQELQTKVNRELEEKVAERTEEINRQKEEITAERTKVELERNRSDRLLLNILPREIADELKQTGHATPRLYEEVSILFVDIIGFSKMVSDMSPVDLVKDLDYCFTAFDYIVTQNNLEKIKTIGDAYLCVGGLPVENKTHAKDAISVAMEMLRFVQNWEYDNPVLGHEGLNLRIGVHTGSVIAGVVGKKKFQYDIWGDAVNLASRMESHGAPGKINISQTTYDLVKDSFDCHHRGKFLVKNMGEVDMYFVGNRIEDAVVL